MIIYRCATHPHVELQIDGSRRRLTVDWIKDSLCYLRRAVTPQEGVQGKCLITKEERG